MKKFIAFHVAFCGLFAAIWPGKGFEGAALAWLGVAIIWSDKS